MSNTETVTIARAVYDQLAADAQAWRELGRHLQDRDPALAFLLESPAVRELLTAEWLEWDRRRTAADTSHAVSQARNWSQAAPSYAELARRRAQLGRVAVEYKALRAGQDYEGGPVDWKTGRPLRRSQNEAA